MRARRTLAALVAAVTLVVCAASASATQLPPNSTGFRTSSNCTLTFTYGNAYGIVPVGKIESSGHPAGSCAGSSVTLVEVDANNVLHNVGPCVVGATVSSPHCDAAGYPTYGEQATGTNYRTAFGLVIRLCNWGACNDYYYSALG